MADRFKDALAFAWRPENDGQSYHTDAGDPGGGTAWGVTEGTWATAVQHGLVSGTLATAGKGDLATVLRVMFWNAVRGDALPAGVDTLTFDMAMLAGPGRATKLLQRALGVDQDGLIGPLTLLAVHGQPAKTLITQMAAADDGFFEGLMTFRLFGRGWERRIADAQRLALILAAMPTTTVGHA